MSQSPDHDKENVPPKRPDIPIPTYQLPHLSALQEPIYRNPAGIEAVLVPADETFETGFSPRSIDGRTNNWKRRQHALALGRAGLKRPMILLDTKDSRNRRVFSQDWNTELQTLDDLTQPFKLIFEDESHDPIVYGVPTQQLELLTTRLKSRVNRLLRMTQQTQESSLPPIPVWGDDEHPAEAFYTKDDYEILLVTYRCEVESFMIIIHGKEEELQLDKQEQPSTPTKLLNVMQPVPVSPYKEDIARVLNRFHLKQRHAHFGDDIEQQESKPYGNVPSPTRQTEEFFSQPPANRSSRRGIFSDWGSSMSGPLMTDAFSSPNFRLDGDYSKNSPEVEEHYNYADDEAEYSLPSYNPFARKPGSKRTPFIPQPLNRSMPNLVSNKESPFTGSTPSSAPPRTPHNSPSGSQISPRNLAPHFDTKLKPDIVPEWDGDEDTLLTWLHKVNTLAERSEVVAEQLGAIIPFRLKGEADEYWCSLPKSIQIEASKDWISIRHILMRYFMNDSWTIRQREKCRLMKWREAGHYKERPSEYFVRKKKLLDHLWSMSEGEIMREILNGAPRAWSTILTPHLMNLNEFQGAIKFHEEVLMTYQPLRTIGEWKTMEQRNLHDDNRFNNKTSPHYETSKDKGKPSKRPRAFIGASSLLSKPRFPCDDTNISKNTTC
jgi:hypothetical protein